jgi:5-guanidino-2-oxopentanoate decarboxylase
MDSFETETKRTTGWVVLETLANYGIDTVFGIPGTHNLEFYRALDSLGIHPVTTRHEQGAGYGGDGWSLQTGKPSVIITTSGPGLLNSLSGAGTAYCESRPMIVLSPGPARGQEFADVGTLHETKDQLTAAAAIVEWGRRVSSAEEAVQAVHDAYELFETGRPRPVYIEVPLDVLEEETDIDQSQLARREHQGIPAPNTDQVAQAAELLASSEHPAILAGGGSRGAGDQVRELAEKLGAPIVTTLNAKGVVDEHHPLSLGANLRLPAVRNVARDADVLLVVGSVLGDAELWVDALEARGKVIRVDILESQIDKNQEAAVGIVGDARAVLQALIAELGDVEARDPGDIAGTLERMYEESLEMNEPDTTLGLNIAKALPSDSIVTTDSSQIAYWGLLNMFKASTPNSTPYMPKYATLGYATPAAIGAKVASPNRPVVAVTGDGALMFSVNEFITAVEQKLDLIVIVVNNGGYEEIRQNEAAVGIAPVAVDLVQPQWAALADAFGGKGRDLDDVANLKLAVDEAISEGGLQLIHISPKTKR